MKNFYTLFTLTILSINFCFGSGIYTVGIGQNFTTLKSAFDAVNNGTISGDIVFQISTDCNEGASGTPRLNASGSGNSNYSSILIYPSGNQRKITGVGISTLLSLNGADNVVIDGRVNQTGSIEGLLFELTSVSATNVVEFVNDATNNILKYCAIKGSMSGFSGVIQFGASSNGGNDNNTIDHCSITKSGNNFPKWLLTSDGSLSNLNNDNRILNSKFYDFTREAIILRSGSESFIIEGNSFYQTSSYTPISNTSIINLNAGKNYTIKGNYFGGQDEKCGNNSGNPYTVNNSNYSFSVINFSTSISGTNVITGNTFQNIKVTSTSISPAFNFIYIQGGTSNYVIG